MKSAFTLLELAVVLVIIALVMGIGFSSSQDMIASANQVSTNNRLDAIEKALLDFWQKNGRLPCPADATLAATNANYGIEAANTNNNCAGGTPAANFTSATNFYKAASGTVPVKTLGLPTDFMNDAWQRKIEYAVKPEFATVGVRNRVPIKAASCVDNTAIKITDIGGSTRSSSAVYALISYGKNGHGAYPSTGSTRYNAAATNTDELINCHCNSSAGNTTYDGNYVLRSPNLSSTTANYFDDIVRYKERWQLISPEDSANDSGYRGPDLAIAFQKAATGTVYTYKNQCAGFVKQAALSPLPTEIARGVAFTASNQHLLTYSALGCNLYKLTGSSGVSNLSTAFSTACTYNASGTIALSNNGYLAVADTTNIKFWKQSGDSFLKLSSSGDLANSSTLISFSPDATYFAALPTASATTIPVYKRIVGDIFTTSGITAPSHVTATAKNSVAFSPDGKYLAATSDTNIYLWRILANGSFIALSTISPASSTGLTAVTFSPDGRYFVVGRAETPYLIIYKIDPSDTFTALSAPTGVPAASTGVGFAFSTDSNYLLMLTANTSYPALMFRKESVSNFKYLTFPFPVGTTPTTIFDNILAASAGSAVAFSK